MLTPRPEAALGGKRPLLSTWQVSFAKVGAEGAPPFSFSTPQTNNDILGDVSRQALLIFGQT